LAFWDPWGGGILSLLLDSENIKVVTMKVMGQVVGQKMFPLRSTT